MTDIVKIQVPLITNDPMEYALVYAEGKTRIVQQGLNAVTRKLMGDDRKAFFEAEFRHGRWTIGKRVADQNW